MGNNIFPMEQLYTALIENDLQRIHQLLSLNLSQEDLYWVLWASINYGSVNINYFKAILPYCDVNFKSENGQPHILHAASRNNIEIVQLLLDHGAHYILSEFERNLFQNKGYTEVIDLIDNYDSDPIKEPEI